MQISGKAQGVSSVHCDEPGGGRVLSGGKLSRHGDKMEYVGSELSKQD